MVQKKNERWMNDLNLSEKWKTYVFKNERSYWKKTILLNYSERNKLNRWKMDDNFFWTIEEKRTQWVVHIDGRTKWKKPNTSIFTWDSFSKLIISLYFTKQKKLRILLKRGIHIITHFCYLCRLFLFQDLYLNIAHLFRNKLPGLRYLDVMNLFLKTMLDSFLLIKDIDSSSWYSNLQKLQNT